MTVIPASQHPVILKMDCGSYLQTWACRNDDGLAYNLLLKTSN